MTDDIFSSLIKETGNEYASIADEGIEAGDVTGLVDTGSFALNALISGSIYGGLPANKVTALAGEPSTGKTFYTINIVRKFLEDNLDGFVFYFESESAISREMLIDRGVDTKRVAILPVATIQEFRTQAVKILDKYLAQKERKPMFFVLDSLGNLSTEKEMQDIADGKDTRDMTRAQLIRGAFRVLTLKLGKAKVTLLVTNHVYDQVGAYIPTKKMGGGSGLEYAASTIIFLSKKKDKMLDDDDGRTGAVITAHTKKARLTIEDKKVETWLNYSSGLDPYYGLLDLAEQAGIVKKVSTRYEFPNGTKEFEKGIKKNPEKFFTKEILDQIDDFCKKEFLYGKDSSQSEDELEENDND
ncbi:MAG: recombinase RecA [Alphaproteobacteria bacterium]|nr:recombinase RecA [Alphaproteobacteria bacterium]